MAWGKLIANADITDPLIYGRQISAFSSLWKYMEEEPEMISMISKVFHLCPQNLVQDENN